MAEKLADSRTLIQTLENWSKFQLIAKIGGCFRLGNLDLDFEIRISDSPIKHEILTY